MEIAATLSLVTHGLATYDPRNDVKYVVCTGMNIMPPPGSLSITERASLERGNSYNQLCIRVKNDRYLLYTRACINAIAAIW